jgi:hypothetical protein
VRTGKRTALDGYVPLAWDAASTLDADEQAIIEAQRKDLWSRGVRTEPQLTDMAFQFGAVVCMFRGKETKR